MDLKQNKTSILTKLGTHKSWWFVFRDGEDPLLSRMLRSGFRHAFVITKMNNITLAIDPLKGAAEITLMETPTENILVYCRNRNWRVVHIMVRATPEKFVLKLPIISCAMYLAYTVGLRFYGVTPWQLYKKLIKMGGDEL